MEIQGESELLMKVKINGIDNYGKSNLLHAAFFSVVMKK